MLNMERQMVMDVCKVTMAISQAIHASRLGPLCVFTYISHFGVLDYNWANIYYISHSICSMKSSIRSFKIKNAWVE